MKSYYYSFLLFVALMIIGNTAFADTPRKMVVENGRMIVVPVDDSDASSASWVPDGPIDSFTISYGGMANLLGSYGAALDLLYYRQTNSNERQGISFRWFHDYRHDTKHFIGHDWDGWYKNTQVEMATLDYQIQTFKRNGDWEYSVAGGFGLGFARAKGCNRRTAEERELYLNNRTYENRDDDGSGALGDALANIFIFGFHDKDWDVFLDVAVTAAMEYYLNNYFSIGGNISAHWHSLIYLDISASAQLKVLF